MPIENPLDLTELRIFENFHIRLLSQHLLQIDSGWDYPDVASAFWRLYINECDGASLLLPGGKRYTLTGGRVHLVPAWLRFTCHCDRVMNHFFMHFDLIGLPAPLVRRVFDAPFTVTDDALVAPLAHALTDLARRGQDRELCAISLGKSLAHASLADWIGHLPTSAARRCRQFAAEANPVRPALRYIEQHLADPIDNAELASLCNFSTHHFIRVFRATVGQTPARYVLERRVALAAEQLAFSDESIPRIAERAGFANRYHFSRAFAQIVGVPPAAYRNRAHA